MVENTTIKELPSPDMRRWAWRFVLLLGVVSLFGDMTYEGARSITGPFLAVLGASGAAVGFVAGFGELVGYGLRLGSGMLSDRTGRYWAITITGYAINLLAVPLLALAGSWQAAALLMIAERVGKALRAPARDAMLSHAASEVGGGRAFGVHEAMDQVGAVIGPLIVAGVLAVNGDYRTAFAVLLIPALAALGVLFVARRAYPHPQNLEAASAAPQPNGLTRSFWIYLAAASLIAAGYADYSLIAFHFEQAAVAPATWIPILYAIAMATDALAALLFGYWYDKAGIVVLAGAVLLSALFPALVFLGGFSWALAGVAAWGIGMGAQESIMRAVVGQLVPPDRRGSAYGFFNATYGLAWFLGSVLLGVLYDRSLLALVAVATLLQLAAIPILIWLRRSWR